MRLSSLRIVAPLIALALLPAAARAAPAPKFDPHPDQWIVQLDAAPVAPGLTPHTQAANDRVAQLDRVQSQALAQAAPGVKPDVSYRTALAGFAAHLTDAQATAMRSAPGVKRVTREQFLHTTSTAAAAGVAGSEADLLGLPGGLWKQLGGAANAGKDVIVGVVDSGITPEAPSFADRGLTAPASWDGACQAGDRFPVTSCTNKLIGARYFDAGIGEGSLPPGTFISPRDEAGHGTHVAASAVGDRGVDPSIGGDALGVANITGIAPAAQLAVYKACWADGVCSNVDVIAAVDRAVADGVDVLNLSLGGGRGSAIDPLEVALLNADAAGVFVAVAAGNDGDHIPIGNPAAAPWTTAVAASTGTRTFRTTLHVSGAASADVQASTVARGEHAAPVVDPAQWGDGGLDWFDDPRYCVSGITPERVSGKIVICDAFAPAQVYLPVLQSAGAAGLILVTGDDQDDPANTGAMPTFYVDSRNAAALRAAVDKGPATVSSADAAAAPWQPDRVAWFSSRGPGDATADLLRPDVSAPGVNVLSAYAPDTFLATQGLEGHERFAALSGTSMASPQVAGVGALLTQAHPTWSPAAIRSALVTTARPALDSDGSRPAPLMTGGAGRIDPAAAADPGLVLEPSTNDYQRYAEGIDPGSLGGVPLKPLAPRDLDLPSISLGDETEPVALTRTVTSVASTRATYTSAFEGAGIDPADVVVNPKRFTIAPGQKQLLTISIASPTGSKDFRDGAIVLRAPGHVVRMPVTLHDPGVIDPPKKVTLSGAEGDQPVDLTIASTVEGQAEGLVAPELRRDQQTADAGGDQQYVLPLDVPAGTGLLSAEVAFQGGTPDLFGVSIDRDSDGDGRDSPADEVVSHTGESDPRADATELPAGRYFIHVAVAADDPVKFDLRTWLAHDAGSLRVDGGPQFAFPAAQRTFSLHWSGAAGPDPLRGVVLWHDGDHPLGATIVDAG